MKLKVLLNDIKDIIVYFATEPFIQFRAEAKDVWNTVTNKRMWFFVWATIFIVSSFFYIWRLMIISLVMSISFFVIYHIQTGKWKERAREKWYKKQGLKKFKG